MPCHIALPEISETFDQSGHITHLLAVQRLHTPRVPGPGAEVKTVGQTNPFGSSLSGAIRPSRKVQCCLACSARLGREYVRDYVDLWG